MVLGQTGPTVVNGVTIPQPRGNLLEWGLRVSTMLDPAGQGVFPSDYAEKIQEAVERRKSLTFLKKTFVVALFGERGSMKSALMCYAAYRRVMMGGKVYYWPPSYGFVLGTPLELEELVLMLETEDQRLRGALLLLDEFQILATKWRMGSRVNLEIRTMFQQLRKMGCDIMITSNSEGEIDPTIQDHVDYHIFCTGKQDKRCEMFGRHLSRFAGDYDDCRDAVQVEIYDTQMRHGAKSTYDGRKRRKHLMGYATGIADIYTLYNTFGTVSHEAIRSVTSDSISAKLKPPADVVNAEVARDFAMNIIPQLVAEHGLKTITPAVLETSLRRANYEVPLQSTSKQPILNKQYIGTILMLLELEKKRTSEGVVYGLPPKDGLKAWQMYIVQKLMEEQEEGQGALLVR